MTSSAQRVPEFAPSQWSFRLCTDCPSKIPHGYFWDQNGDRSVQQYLTTTSAIAAIEGSVRSGSLGRDEADGLITMVTASGLPTESEQEVRDSRDSRGDAAAALIALLLLGGEYDPEESSTYKFVVEKVGSKLVGRFENDEGYASPQVPSKKMARSSLSFGLITGMVASESKERLLAEVEASELPEDDELPN